eukprot:1346021-Rhodomonas_salina.2
MLESEGRVAEAEEMYRVSFPPPSPLLLSYQTSRAVHQYTSTPGHQYTAGTHATPSAVLLLLLPGGAVRVRG